MNAETVLVSLGSVILGGGLVSGIAAFRKAKPESDQIIVSSAKDVVLIQAGALDDLRAALAELRREHDEMERRFERQTAAATRAIEECHRERNELRHERDTERASNRDLRFRIEALETEVAQLRDASGPHPITPTEGNQQ